jgi:1,4-alpha-glucan branching enzyme
MDIYGFYTGQIFDAHKHLGAHREGSGYTFRVYAPHTNRITLVGEFNDWQDWEMHHCYNEHFWEVHVPQAVSGQRYLYKIWHEDGNYTEHCDPYGFGMDLRPAFCSVLRDLSEFQFTDQPWMKRRSDCKDRPLHIYELHCGSWQQKKASPDDEKGVWYNYDELADLLIPYVKDMGYNYIELMPIAEHPADESWGYQNTGFFSPTARYGTAAQLKSFVNKCHHAGIGVLLDFVPVHFAVDSYGLARFDGAPLYEYPDAGAGISEWGSYNFMHSKGEVRSFLQSCAVYWLEEYHFDGLRMDAISRMIYWHGKSECGVNNSALSFIRTMNSGIKARFPGVMLCAEDSTDFPKVTAPVWSDGLGFDYKWDMGFMHDTLSYFQTDSYFRSGNYNKLTFSMMYYHSEYYILPFSHDENVHGKATILQKMHGLYEGKFAQARAFYMYNAIHPGKMLDFMGSEFGQLREWDESREQDWFLLKYPIHDAFHRFIKELNHLYLDHSALYERDYESGGFGWKDASQNYPCCYTIQRYSSKESIVGIFNFAGSAQENYTVHCDAKRLTVLMDSSADIYNGTRPNTAGTVIEGNNGSFTLTLPPFTAICLQAE